MPRPSRVTTAYAAEKVKPVTVFVSILPQSYFVERIGGDLVDVKAMLKPGQSPATYSPSARQILALSKAELYFSVGVPFEKSFLHKIANTTEGLKLVDTRKGVKLRKMEAHHHHEGTDPHIWLSPILVKKQAQTIYEALVEIRPKEKPRFKAGYDALIGDLERIHSRIKGVPAPLKGRDLFVFHPAYGYFADTYGLNQVAVEVEGKAPDAKSISRFIDMAKKSGVKVFFVQPQFSNRSARAIAGAIDGAVVSLDPLAKDYIANLEEMAEKIEKALGK